MDQRRVEIFRAVAHAGSMAAAARELGWTQPAVSQHVQALERQLGAPLVVRTPRGVRLTEAGAVLLVHADAVAARLRSAEQELAALAGLASGTVRLAAFPSTAATLLPQALAALPDGITVLLSEAEPPEALLAVDGGEVDGALVFVHPSSPPLPDQLARTVLLRDPLHLVLPAGSPHDRVDALAGERWIAGCVRCREQLLQLCANAGFVPDLRHSTDDYVVVQALVAAGLGVALLPALALRAYTHPDVTTVPLRPAAHRDVLLVSHVESTRTPALRALTGALQHAAGP